MDFPADITLRKTRMKFELTFKVVLLFSYQGFAFMRKLLYFITSTFVCQELFKFFQLLFWSCLTFFFLSFAEEVVLLCRATFISYHTSFVLSRTFSFLWRFSFRFLSNQCVLMCNVWYLTTDFYCRQEFFYIFLFSISCFRDKLVFSIKEEGTSTEV